MDTPVCTVSFDREVPCLVMEWNGYATSKQFRTENERVLLQLIETGTPKMLADATRFTLIGADDQHWLIYNWLPRTIRAGLRCCALVSPLAYFNKVAVDNVVRHIDPSKLKVQYFDSREAARRWLREV